MILGPAPREVVGGATSAVVLLAIDGGYGIVALAPLGPAYVSTGFLMGVFAGVVANLVTALCGDRGPLISGPSAATALLLPPLLLKLMALPGLRLADGRPDAPQLLAIVAAGIALAGALQWLVGRVRLGGVVRYVPYPVHAGFLTGVAVLMAIAMLPHALGLPVGEPVRAWTQGRPLALAVAALSLFVALWLPRVWPRVPALLAALGAGMLLHHGLLALAGPARLGPMLGPLAFVWPDPTALARLAGQGAGVPWAQVAGPVLLFAVVLALTASMQALMAGSVVDSLTGQRRDGDRLLRAQGLANVAGGLLGLMPAAGAVASSVVNLRAGGLGTASRVVHSLTLLLALTVGVGLMRHVPMAAIAGVLVAIAWGLVDGWSRRSLASVLRSALRGRGPGAALAGPVGVMALVAMTAITVSLIAGVAVGTLAAVLLFVRVHLRPPVRRVVTADRRGSRKLRPPAATATLREHGQRIVVVELDGALFFGTADAASREIECVTAGTDELVLDFRRVGEVDASGARVLLQTAAALRAAGRRLSLAALPAADPRARLLRAMDTGGLLPETAFYVDTDRALEQAEDRLLALLQPAADPEAGPLPLAHTRLATGLDEAQRATLTGLLREQRLVRGQRLFRRGEPSDALYVLMQGQIAIVLPAAAGGAAAPASRRLVSFAPGAVFGEMGLLQGAPRSADALAEDDSVLCVLDRGGYAHLAAQHPALHGQLMRNLALHLADRLGALTIELQALDEVAPPAPPA